MIAAPPGATDPVDCVVLAGSVNRIPLYPGNTPGYKALVPMRGRPLMAYVMDALCATPQVRSIYVVGALPVLQAASAWPRVTGVTEAGSLLENALTGLGAAQSPRVLYCNPDQPLLTPAMVERFLQPARASAAQLVSSWVRRQELDRLGHYPEGDHKFATFADGRFAHGNLFLIDRSLRENLPVRRRLDRLYAARKNNLAFAWELGPSLFLRFVLARLTGKLPTLAHTLELAQRRFGITLEAVITPDPEIVLDIDEAEDFAAADRYLAAHGG